MIAEAATVRAILAKLDPSNDEHWTSQGLPRMDALVDLGLNIDRRALNELVPGFSRQVAAAERASEPQPVEPAGAKDGEVDYFTATTGHIAQRAARRKAALEHLIAGGFTLADLAPVRSKLDQAIQNRNRAARRAG